MKKIVITVVAVGLGAVAAYAQNMADARFIADCMKGYIAQKNNTSTATKTSIRTTTGSFPTWGYKPADGNQWTWSYVVSQRPQAGTGSLVRAIEEQNAAHARQAAGRTAPATSSVKAEKSAVSEYPSYLTGREGHMMAMSENSTGRLLAGNRQAERTVKVEKKNESNWFTRLMGFDKYDNETEAEWQARLYLMGVK